LVLADVAVAPDPDQALLGLGRIADAGAPLHYVFASKSARRRLIDVIGLSTALADHLVAVPTDVYVLIDDDAVLLRPTREEIRESFVRAVGADPDASAPAAPDADASRRLALVHAYRRALVQLAARDLSHGWPVDDVAAELADLADGVLEAGLAIVRGERPADAARTNLSVIAMGKAGGRELNYVSDVDVIFVAEPDDPKAMAAANRLAGALIRLISEPGPGGSIWQVDAALRPEGKAGPLVRTVAGHTAYYERWAETWEFQALLKARPAAGDLVVGQAYVDAVSPFVWTAARRDNFVVDVQKMRRRVEEHIPSEQRDRELKLGRGGLRDVEFAVQLLQLVHGRSDVMLRSSTTLSALEALATWGYVGRDDASQLASAYRFLRTLEHHIQLQRLQRTHLLPESEVELRRLGRSMGFRADPAAELLDARRRHANVVRRIHEKLFYRPLLQAVARLEPGEARLTPEAARDRLVALGYVDPEGALRHLRALASGVSRRAAIQRTLLPVLLGWFADAPEPDAALLAFRQVSDALGSTPWFLAALRDGSATAERLARLLSSSRYVTDLLLRAPEGVALVGDDAELMPRGTDEDSYDLLLAEIAAVADRNADPVRAVEAVRGLRRRELLRTASADVLGMTSLRDAQRSLTAISAVTLEGALQVAIASYERATGHAMPTRMAIIAMGRFGGEEVGYGSDVDVMFVHEPLPRADGTAVDWEEEETATRAAMTVANEIRTLLMAPSADPPLLVDADLRPEGRQGPLVRTLDAYAAYYTRWSSPWEAQALLRARPVAGDPDLCARFTELINPVRYPVDGIGADELREMRRLKARMESERLPRGADPTLHTKLGRGGLSDVEWVSQLLQLRHAASVPELRNTTTVGTLQAAVLAELVTAEDATTLIDAWEFASRVRSAVVLARGRASDTVPTDAAELAGVAHLLGYPAHDRGMVLEDYRRTTRRARAVFERLFYGEVETIH
jgi:glutamate-ammonia-ligase adenylyltransferase